jgi:SAM-dependent methyltransferase
MNNMSTVAKNLREMLSPPAQPASTASASPLDIRQMGSARAQQVPAPLSHPPAAPVQSPPITTTADRLITQEPELIPPPELMITEGISTMEEWFRWAEEWSMVLKCYGGMRKSSAVLEVGCGLGRIAFPLRYQLLTGTYDGFDICSFKIDFLKANFEPRYPRFRFQHADVHNTYYNPNGTVTAADFIFPYSSHTFDVVYAASVFTHLLPDSAQRYLHEIARVLKPGGRAVISVFLMDYFQRGLARPLGCALPFFDFHHFPDSRYPDAFSVSDPDNPETVTAYKHDLLLRFVEEAGLEMAEQVIPGMWSGTKEWFILPQELLVLKLRAPRE